MIVTLCGSARFEAWYHAWAEALGLSGHCVFELCAYPSYKDGEKNWYSLEEKLALDALHFTKIECSEAILVLNVFGYVGESTLREIAHARLWRREVYVLETWGEGCGVGEDHNPDYQEAARRFGVAGFRSPGGMALGDQILKDGTPVRNRFAHDLLATSEALRYSLVKRLDQKLRPLKGLEIYDDAK